MQRFGGRTPLIESTASAALYSLPSGPLLRLTHVERKNWGLALVRQTGSKAHLHKLTRITGSLIALEKTGSFPTEKAFYSKFALDFIPPELREGLDEVNEACIGTLPRLVTQANIRGDLHAHTTGSDGIDSLEDMATAARWATNISASPTTPPASRSPMGFPLKTCGPRSEPSTSSMRTRRESVCSNRQRWTSSPTDRSITPSVLRELDYTVCSIHSRFGLGKDQQTTRVLRAMDNRYFNILGHATGRLLLKRPGYELDFERILEHAGQTGCFFELNSSPDRLDISAENARLVKQAGIPIAISTDSHSSGEFQSIRYGIEQARRAALEKADILNCLPLQALLQRLKR